MTAPSRGVRLVRAVRAEATKAAREPSLYILLAILVGYAAILVFGLASALRAPKTSSFDPSALLAPLKAGAVAFLTSILSGIGTILLLIFSAQLIGTEFSRGTLRTLLTSRARRSDVVIAKLVILAFATAAASVIVVAGGVIGALILSQVAGQSFVHADPQAVAWIVARVFVQLAVWAAFGFAVTLWVRSTGVGIGIALGTLFIGDTLQGLLRSLGTFGDYISHALPGSAASLVGAFGPLDFGTWLWVLPNLVVYIIGVNVIAFLVLRQLDVLAATK
ncbi:MAG: ABC transporter permease [Thermoplasmatota archaeon]